MQLKRAPWVKGQKPIACVHTAVQGGRRGKSKGRGLGSEGAKALVQCIEQCETESGSGSGTDESTPNLLVPEVFPE